MKAIIIIIVCLFLNLTNLAGQIKLPMSCEAEVTNDSLVINLKISNFVDSTYQNEYEIDNNKSIFLPISEWLIEGNQEHSSINAWNWINSQFINLIAYIPTQFDRVNEPKMVIDFDNSSFFIQYLPKFVEVKHDDSIILRLKYRLTSKDTIINDGFKIYIQIPFLSAPQIFEICDYLDVVNKKNNGDSELSKYFQDIYESHQNNFELNINQSGTKSIVNRNYNNYTNIIIDEGIRRMLRISILNNVLECNCKINSKK